MVVGGVEDHHPPCFQDLLQEPDIRTGAYDIHWLEALDGALKAGAAPSTAFGGFPSPEGEDRRRRGSDAPLWGKLSAKPTEGGLPPAASATILPR